LKPALRILVLAPQLPWPPRQGTALRNLGILEHLARRHAVTLLCFAQADAEPGPLGEAGVTILRLPPPPPRPIWRRLLDLPITRTPDLLRRLASPAMDAAIDRLAASDARFDVIQIEGMEMAAFGLRARRAFARASGSAPRLVYDAHNAEWLLQDRAWRADFRRLRGLPGAAYSLLQTAKIRHYEAKLLRAADATVAVSAADAAALAALWPAARMAVVPNGVDVDLYRPADASDASGETPERCVYTGKMDFRPNVDAMAWFCEAVWPRLRALRPDASLAIVGRDPAARVLALADPAKGIEVTGAVEDVRPWIAGAGVVVVPLRVGGGTRLKVLEAMAMGKAVVATSLGVEGLDLQPGVEVEIVDEPAAMAASIARLMADPESRAALGRRARARATADYRWEVLVPRIEALYRAEEGSNPGDPSSGSATR
jgi:sugar transferase (PEP-CTERM/EpsH1 system associated)